MNTKKPVEDRNGSNDELEIIISKESIIQLVFLGLLSISFLGTFAFWGHWIGSVFAHFAAISIMGFYGCLTGTLAIRKGRRYWKAFKIGFFVPIILGVISGFLLGPEEGSKLPFTCGGWISLATGIVIVLFYISISKRIE